MQHSNFHGKRILYYPWSISLILEKNCVLLESIVQSLIVTQLYVQYTKVLLENKNDIPSSGTLCQSDAVPTIQAHLVPSPRGHYTSHFLSPLLRLAQLGTVSSHT